MSYPVDDAFVLHHVMLACRRLRLLIVAALLGALFAGAGCFFYQPVKYQIAGVSLANDPAGGSPQIGQDFHRIALKEILVEEFLNSLNLSKLKDSGVTAETIARVVDDTVVIDWRIIGTDPELFENFLKNIPFFTRCMQKRLSVYDWNLYIEKEYSVCSDLKSVLTMTLCCVGIGCLGGLMIGFVISLLITCCDRSINDLRKFEQSYSLAVLGVLPSTAGMLSASPEKLMTDDFYAMAVKSLMLNVMFCKPPASRAFVTAVCGMTGKCGVTSVVNNLGKALQLAGSKVLLLNKENCNMTVADQLADRMEELLSQYSPDYDFIIIDLPDAQSSSVPLIVSKLADTLLLVCDCRNFSSYIFKLELWRFRKASIKLAGCIINYFPVGKHRAEFDFYQQLFYRYREKQK